MYLKLLIILAFIGATHGFAEDLPPLGKRKYLIDSGGSSNPAVIKNAKEDVKAVYMKDPVGTFVDKEAIFKPSKRRIQAKTKLKMDNKAKVAQLTFNTLSINGRKTKPRVKFNRELIEVDRADEPLNKDFYDKVFLPANDADF